ncbi:MAG: hypothetical protein ACXABY_12535 [Candidatus Thorarchaeota archaeon]|jgi:hypothetical protein
MTIDQLKANDFKIWADVGEKTRARLIKQTDYLECLASDLGIDMKGLDISRLFVEPLKFPAENNRLNKLFIIHCVKSQASHVHNKPMDHAKLRDLMHNIKMQRDAASKDIERKIYHGHDELIELSYKINDKVREVGKLRFELASMRRQPINLAGQITRILEKGFWSIDRVNKVEVTLKSIPVICTHRVGVTDYKMNFGSYILKINAQDMSARIQNEDVTKHIGMSCHPHINSSPCWGSLVPDVDQAYMDRDIFKLSECYRKILYSYVSGDAYVSLSRFWLKANPDKAPKIHRAYHDCNSGEDFFYDLADQQFKWSSDYEPIADPDELMCEVDEDESEPWDLDMIIRGTESVAKKSKQATA